MTHELPATYDPDDNRIVALPQAIIPIIAGRLRTLEYEASWAANQREGVQAALLVQERLITPYTDASGYDLPASYDINNFRMIAIPRALLSIISGRLDDLTDQSAWIEEDMVAGPAAIALVQEQLVYTAPTSPPPFSDMTGAMWWDAKEDASLAIDLQGQGGIPGFGERIGQWRDRLTDTVASAISNDKRPTRGDESVIFGGAHWLIAATGSRLSEETIVIVATPSGGGYRSLSGDSGSSSIIRAESSGAQWLTYRGIHLFVNLSTNIPAVIVASFATTSSLSINTIESVGNAGITKSSNLSIGAGGTGGGYPFVGLIQGFYYLPFAATYPQRDMLRTWFEGYYGVS